MSACSSTPAQRPAAAEPALLPRCAPAIVGCRLQEQAREGIEAYGETLTREYEAGMAAKLGLRAYDREVAIGFLKLLYDDQGGWA